MKVTEIESPAQRIVAKLATTQDEIIILSIGDTQILKDSQTNRTIELISTGACDEL